MKSMKKIPVEKATPKIEGFTKEKGTTLIEQFSNEFYDLVSKFQERSEKLGLEQFKSVLVSITIDSKEKSGHLCAQALRNISLGHLDELVEQHVRGVTRLIMKASETRERYASGEGSLNDL